MKLTLNEVIIMQLARTREHEKQMHGVRLVMWEIRTKYLKKGKTIQPKDIFPLGLDGIVKEPVKRITKEQFLELKNRHS